MKFIPAYIIILTCFFAIGHSQFQCYECDDCGVLVESQLIACPTVPITIPTSTPENTTTALPGSSKSTTSPTEKSTGKTTTTSSQDTTASPGSSESTVSSTEKSTEPTTTTPSPSSQDTTASPGSSESTISSTEKSAEPTTTTPSPSSQDTPASPGSSESTISSTSLIETTASQRSSESTIPSSENKSEKVVRALEKAIIENLSNNSRQARSLRAGPISHCYSIDVLAGNGLKGKKGCITVNEDEDVCKVLKTNHGESAKNCKVCRGDKCNSGIALKYSISTLAIPMLISLFVYK